MTDLRFAGVPVGRVDGDVKAFVPRSYERAGLEEDYGYVFDPNRVGMPAAPVATKAMFRQLRDRVLAGRRVMALAVGYGTTRLDEHGRPTDVSSRLKGIDMEVVEVTREKIVIRDPRSARRGRFLRRRQRLAAVHRRARLRRHLLGRA